ncbi:MAG: hypothetical protein LBF51_07650 [Zoogloeaceae bacterium]|jgi:hypothetical protein|nr:hypothetical protein [Zoogloeaceae bacterium]
MDNIPQLQTPASNGLLSSIGQGNALAEGKGNPPRTEDASGQIPPASTRVNISIEGQTRLAAEQAIAANPLTTPATPETVGANRGSGTPPVTPAIATATLASAPAAAIGQGATQAAAADPVTPVTLTTTATNAPAGATNASEAANVAYPATPETGNNTLRQETERATQQEDSRQNDAAAARQDAGPVLTQSANTARNALSA